jgi:sugar/nucleoside kinase (ribokinase family)
MPGSDTIHVVGEVMVDVIALASGELARGSDTPATISDRDGGSAANLAAWLASLGTPVTLIARVGADARGDAALASLAGAGVRLAVARDPHRPTGRCVVIVTPDGERTMLPDPGANAGLIAADLPSDQWSSGDHLHVSGYSLLREGSRDAALAALATARELGLTVSVDASSAEPVRAVGAPAFLSWLHPGDVLFANAAEATALTGEPDPSRALAALADRGLVAVVKLGSRGAAAARGDVRWEVDADEAQVADTTGAGDAFAAGFLTAWVEDRDLAVALALGTRVAARAVSHPGGRP